MNAAYKERMENLVSPRDLKLAQDMLRILHTEWLYEGFDTEDVQEYFKEFIDTI